MGKLMTLGYGFLIPIFFIYQGFSVSLLDLFDPWAFGLLVVILIISTISRFLPMVLSGYFAHKRTDIAGALLLGTNLSVIVAGVNIGREAGLIHGKMSSILILYAVVSSILFPVLFRWFFTKHLSHLVHSDEMAGEAG